MTLDDNWNKPVASWLFPLLIWLMVLERNKLEDRKVISECPQNQQVYWGNEKNRMHKKKDSGVM